MGKCTDQDGLQEEMQKLMGLRNDYILQLWGFTWMKADDRQTMLLITGGAAHCAADGGWGKPTAPRLEAGAKLLPQLLPGSPGTRGPRIPGCGP